MLPGSGAADLAAPQAGVGVTLLTLGEVCAGWRRSGQRTQRVWTPAERPRHEGELAAGL